MKLDEILKEEIHLDENKSIEVDQYGVRRIWINDQHLVHFRNSPDENFFYVYAKVAPLPSPPFQLKVYETLLSANLFGEETGNSVLTIHLKSESIILMRTFQSAITSLEVYSHDFQHFLTYLVYWKEKIKKLSYLVDRSQEDILNIMSKRNQTILFI